MARVLRRVYTGEDHAIHRQSRTLMSVARSQAPLAPACAFIVFLLTSACATAPQASIGNPERGRQTIAAVGCGSCHRIEGVAGAEGTVAPPLTGIASRAIIGGALPNTPANMLRWIENPQAITPGVAMPPLENETDARARDIVAYLYTLK